MNWEAIGAVGEIASAIGVIASLIYLASQIRIQNSESQSRAISDIGTKWNTILGDLATNLELARTWKIGIGDIEALDEIQLVIFFTHTSRVFKVFEGFHQQWITKNLSDETWIGLDNGLIDVCQYPGIRAWWGRRSHWYSEEFQAHIGVCMGANRSANLYGELENQSVQNDT